ncbi:hypothetical protein DFR76_102582 [Nocardia pseudobrasiliensis]|uniref:Uncharacterized protein n=1 Tax=Nocardia pseudobrasiliensis TaxID=45979 RepID=A0A370IDG1_9NOCA|nr:hypothetical protein DFR76_102582 [Nocardia pseudobrasiliensis]
MSDISASKTQTTMLGIVLIAALAAVDNRSTEE